jgi:hypothetical protein
VPCVVTLVTLAPRNFNIYTRLIYLGKIRKLPIMADVKPVNVNEEGFHRRLKAVQRILQQYGLEVQQTWSQLAHLTLLTFFTVH